MPLTSTQEFLTERELNTPSPLLSSDIEQVNLQTK
jgi:hypothetical protein